MRRADDAEEEDEEGMMAEGENAEVPVAARRTHETAVAAMDSFIPFYVLFYGFLRKICFFGVL